MCNCRMALPSQYVNTERCTYSYDDACSYDVLISRPHIYASAARLMCRYFLLPVVWTTRTSTSKMRLEPQTRILSNEIWIDCVFVSIFPWISCNLTTAFSTRVHFVWMQNCCSVRRHARNAFQQTNISSANRLLYMLISLQIVLHQTLRRNIHFSFM